MFKVSDDNVIIKLREPIDEFKEIEIINLKGINSEKDNGVNRTLNYEGFIEKIQINTVGN